MYDFVGFQLPNDHKPNTKYIVQNTSTQKYYTQKA